jgi:hypothetical protein
MTPAQKASDAIPLRHHQPGQQMENAMKALTILDLILTALIPALPASATPYCTGNPDEANNQSSLSSTSAGGQNCQQVYILQDTKG